MNHDQLNREVAELIEQLKANLAKESSGIGNTTTLHFKNGQIYLQIKEIYEKHNPKKKGWLKFLKEVIPYLNRTTVDRHILVYNHSGIEKCPSIAVLGTTRIFRIVKIWGKDDDNFKVHAFLKNKGITIPAQDAPWPEKQTFIDDVKVMIKGEGKKEKMASRSQSEPLNSKIEGVLTQLEKYDERQAVKELDLDKAKELLHVLTKLIREAEADEYYDHQS